MRILTLLGLVLFPAVRASLIFSKLHTCKKIRVPTVCRGGRVADRRDRVFCGWEGGR